MMKQGELKVLYKGDLNQKLDKAIEGCLKEFGYERWASGYGFAGNVDGVRDLAFDKTSGRQTVDR